MKKFKKDPDLKAESVQMPLKQIVKQTLSFFCVVSPSILDER